ncbi:MAG TPA: kelch repeat-containing protein [bacterium]|nr:kelch repeat-containing protein [bacterium]
MEKSAICLLSALLLLFVSCELNEQGGIRLHYTWTDAEGNDITPPDMTVLFAWGELTYGKEKKTTQPVWMGAEDATLRFDDLPYATAMVMKITMRRAEAAGGDSDIIGPDDAPEARPDNVAYYCASQEFKLTRGKVTDVNNACVMEPAPGVDPETGEATAPKIMVFDPDGKELTDTDPTTRHSTVTLCYHTFNATKVLIAADPDFADAVTETIPEATGLTPCPAGYHRHTDWELDPPEILNDRAQQTVFLKATDAQGYETKPASRKIFIDNKPPVMVNPLINPENANGTDTVSVSFSFHEPVGSVVLDAGTIAFERTGDLTDAQLFIYEHKVVPADAEGEHSFTVTATDEAGNEAETALTDTLTIDKTPPAIEEPAVIICDGDDCATEKTKGKVGDTVKISFGVSEPITVPPTVQIAGKDMALCEGTTGYEYCYVITTPEEGETDGAKPVTVLLTDDAGNNNAEDNKLETMPYFDVTPPQILNSSISPTAAKNGAEVVVSFTFSEPVTDYTFAVSPLAFTQSDCATSDEQLYSCAYTVAGTETQNTPYQPAVACSDEAGNECAAYIFDSFEIDYTIPTITVNGCTVQTRRGIAKSGVAAATHDDVVEVTLDMTVEAGITPLVSLGSIKMSESCETPAAGCFAHTVTDADSEGFKLVGIDAVDAAGNPYSATVNLAGCRAQYDFTGPVLASALLQRLPDFAAARDNLNKTLLFSLTDPLTDEAVTAQLNLYADEELDPATLLITGFDFGDPTGVQDNFAQFEKTLDDSIAAGQHTFAVTWRDVLGNEETRPIDWKMFLDKTAPDTAVVDMKKVLYTRKPWGTDDTAGKPKFSVAGEAGAVGSSDIATIIAYNEQGSIIGQTSVTGGAFDIPTLTGGDLPNIYLNPVKKSGVKATGNGALVTEIQWHATMGGKVPGSLWKNAHVFTSSPFFGQALNQLMLNSTEPSLEGMDKLSHKDSDAMIRMAETSWQQFFLLGTKPSARYRHALAYDSARGKVVLFGGSPVNNETWEWDGITGTWTDRTPVPIPSSWPTARYGHALTYDSARGKVVLFGGYSNGYRQDTWEWDGATGTWIDRTTDDTKPSARMYHSLAYDSDRGKIMLFGGSDDEYNSRKQDTWEYDGSTGTWTNRTPAPIPSSWPTARADSSLAFDTNRRKIVLFGGYDGMFKQDTWEWNGATGAWTDRTPSPIPSSWPTARAGHVLAYDSSRGKVVLSGKLDLLLVDTIDTWEWDGTTGTWTDRSPSGTRPIARSNHALAYDSVRSKVVLFGGTDDTQSLHQQDTWEWDGTAGTWTDRTPSDIKPVARTHHALAYDRVRGKVVLFGGYSNGYRQDTWEWDGTAGTWTNRTPSPIPSSWPAARARHALAYDSARSKVVLFGGDSSDGHRQDIWEWDGATGTWANRTPAPIPSSWPTARAPHTLAYDIARNKIVLFGGYDNTFKQDTWEWDGATGTWANRAPSPVPPLWPSVRAYHALAYDNARSKVVLFGGTDYDNKLDTWEWNGSLGTWTNRTPSPIPSNWPAARNGHDLAYDSVRNKVSLFGGWDDTYYRQDSWEWDSTSGTWVDRTPAISKPTSRSDHALTYDSVRGRVVLFGGESSGANKQDTWEYDGGGQQRPAQLMKTVFPATGVTPETVTLQSITSSFNVGGTGYTGTNCGAVNGAKMMVWNTAYRSGAWMEVASNSASSSAVDTLEFTTSDPDLMKHLFFGDEKSINVAVAPISPNGCGTDMGSIATDYAEVTVRYSLDPAAEQPDPRIEDHYAISADQLGWHDARQTCRMMGGDLVVINSELEQHYLEKMLDPTKTYWIGATDEATEGDWRWVDGTLFWKGNASGTAYGYTNWEKKQPDNYGAGQDHAVIWANQNYQWDDAYPTTTTYYICEFTDEFFTCGDGTIQEYEECDDTNTDTTDACVFCKNSVCGDGFVLDSVETCDDQNTDEADGCYSNCKAGVLPKGNHDWNNLTGITGWTCDEDDWAGAVSVVINFYDADDELRAASGTLIADEVSEAAVHTECGGVAANHRFSYDATSLVAYMETEGYPKPYRTRVYARDDDFPGEWVLIPTVSNIIKYCGNEYVDAGEACDDGNDNEEDGCLSDCTATLNWVCTGNPSVCGYCAPTTYLATWESDDDGWTYQANWGRQTTAGQGGTVGWMRFDDDPHLTNYTAKTLVSSSSVNIAGCAAPTIRFYTYLEDYDYGGTEYLRLDCSPDGGSSWTQNIWTENNFFSHGWTLRTVTIPTACRTNNSLFRFRATGYDSWNISYWGIDTIYVN